MNVIDFETAKCIAEKLNLKTWHSCYYLYAKDNKRLIDWPSIEADYYLKDDSRFYNAPFVQEVIEDFENIYGWSIFIPPKLVDGKIITYSIITKEGDDKDYSSGICDKNRFESINRAIQETIELILEEKEMCGK